MLPKPGVKHSRPAFGCIMRVVRNSGSVVKAPAGHFVDENGEIYVEVSEAEAEDLEADGIDLAILARVSDLDEEEDEDDDSDEDDE